MHPTFTASDGYPFAYRHYPPEAAARGPVVMIHGIQSHGGWYEASARHLAAAGHDVFVLDRRGSGANDRDRGDCPYFRRLTADIREFISAKCAAPPALVAISWGAKLALALEAEHPGTVSALALLTPGVCAQISPPLSFRLRVALSRLFTPARRFPIPLDDPALFTGNESRRAFIRADPVALREATARFLVESVRLDFVLRRWAPRINVPTLLMLAGRDRITDNPRTRAYVGRFASASKTVLEYPDAHHTLEFEPDPSRIFSDLAGWLNDVHSAG